MKLKINWKWICGLFVGAIGWSCLHGVTSVEHWTAQDFKMFGSVIMIIIGFVIMENS